MAEAPDDVTIIKAVTALCSLDYAKLRLFAPLQITEQEFRKILEKMPYVMTGPALNDDQLLYL